LRRVFSKRASFISALDHIVPGCSTESRLLRAVVRTRDGGYADAMPLFTSHANKTVVFGDPAHDADYQAIAAWIDATQIGPGIDVGNPRSKPSIVALGSDGYPKRPTQQRQRRPPLTRTGPGAP